ncbi:MAG: hypothetical protein KF906_06995 [Actinobacteria bacterium]|nr:hypothetical protein [Actinomycetota bacterium]
MLAAALVGAVGLVVLVVLLCGDGGGPGGARSEVDPTCDLMRPDGRRPSEWFEPDGTLVLDDEQAAGIAIALGMRAELSGDAETRVLSDLLMADPPTAAPLTSEQRRALDDLDRSVVDDCPD